jgi:hypothetical protein
MHAVADRPRVDDAGPLSPAPAIRSTDDGSAFARGAMIATIVALFPWSLLILLIAWLF